MHVTFPSPRMFALSRLSRVAVHVCVTFILLQSTQGLRLLGSVQVTHPGFVTVMETNTSSGPGIDAYVSSFSGAPFSTDHVYRLKDLHLHMTNLAAVHAEIVSHSIVWPNEIDSVPDDVFGAPMFTVAGGFLVPFKTKGTINIFDLAHGSSAHVHEITGSREDHEWFYHRVMWMDMNGDGKKDLVTCRGQKPLIGSSHGELVWYEHPTLLSNVFAYPWTAHVLGDHSDTFFDIATMNTPDGAKTAIFTTGFFSNQLKVHWTEDASGLWTDATKVKSRLIDGTIGHVFDVQVNDLNGDGEMDLLVSTNAPSQGGAVYAFSIPDDFRSGQYTKHKLSEGLSFTVHSILPGSGAPGSAMVLKNSSKNNKPQIVVSGDDNSKAYLLTASSNDQNDWTYTSEVIIDLHHGTIGGIGQFDMDKDGHQELFIPAYTEGKVYVYTTAD